MSDSPTIAIETQSVIIPAKKGKRKSSGQELEEKKKKKQKKEEVFIPELSYPDPL